MKSKKDLIYIAVILVLIVFFFFKSDEYYGIIVSKNKTISNYKKLLKEKESIIEDLNYSIEDTKGYAWESYDEMGDALDNLETIE